jgi:N-acetylglucosaminyldiphosphoundecaprenol N-acetyl-beta-D-mannosaminyltransferase
MIDLGKKSILGIQVDAVDYEAAVARIIAAARDNRPVAVSALAVHGIMTGVLDPTQRYRLNHFDLIVPDGQPVRWALNWLHGAQLVDRVYGPTLMLRVCEQVVQAGLSIYLYGSRPEVINALSQSLQARFPDLVIAGAQPSRFRRISAMEKTVLIADILDSGAAITFVGLGCPRQEVWAYEYHEALSMPVLAVGAAFDFYAGTLPQAPDFLQRSGLEWLYRLMQEPARLWKRYLLLNPLYVMLLVLQKLKFVHFDPMKSTRPTQELRYG